MKEATQVTMTRLLQLARSSPRTKKILNWVGYPCFYLLCLVIFVRLTFPYDRLARRIEAAYNAAQEGPDPSRLQIGDLSGYWLSGIEAEDLRLVTAAARQEATPASSSAAKPVSSAAPAASSDRPDEAEAAPSDGVGYVNASVSLLYYLFGVLNVEFSAEAFGGELDGSFQDSDDQRSLQLELDGMSIGQLPVVKDAVGLPMTGDVTGELDLEFPEGRLGKATGAIDLQVVELSVGDGKAKIRDVIALPKVRAGKLTFTTTVEDGRVQIEEFSVKGPDLELEATGGLRLRDDLDASVVDMKLRFKFSDAYKGRNDMTIGLFGAPGSKASGAFDLDPKNRKAKQPDGSYAWRVAGTLNRLSFNPGAGGASKARGAAPKKRAKRKR